MINRTNTLNKYEYNPDRTLDYFNPAPKHYKKDYDPFKGEIADKQYSEMLDDYKENVISDFHRLNDDIIKTAIEWNCSDQLMSKKLREWGTIDYTLYHNRDHILASEQRIVELYKSGYDIGKIMKIVNLSRCVVRRIIKSHKMEIRQKNVNENYNNIKVDPVKEKELVDFYLQYGLDKTANEYKMSRPTVNRILINNKVNGQYKKNKKHKINTFEQGELLFV